MHGLQDLELPPEVVAAPAHAAEAAVFAAPTPGVSASQRWLQKGNLAAQHAAAGAFDSAMRLLNRCACAPPVATSAPATRLATGPAAVLLYAQKEAWGPQGTPAERGARQREG